MEERERSKAFFRGPETSGAGWIYYSSLVIRHSQFDIRHSHERHSDRIGESHAARRQADAGRYARHETFSFEMSQLLVKLRRGRGAIAFAERLEIDPLGQPQAECGGLTNT